MGPMISRKKKQKKKTKKQQKKTKKKKKLHYDEVRGDPSTSARRYLTSTAVKSKTLDLFSPNKLDLKKRLLAFQWYLLEIQNGSSLT